AVERLASFVRLPRPARDTVRRRVDEDESFRTWLLEHLDEQEVGRLGWLWLSRPEGWERTLAELVGAATDDPVTETAGDARWRRRLDGARRAAERAEQRAVRAEERVAELSARLEELETEVATWRARARTAEEEVRSLTEERARAVRSLKQLEARHRDLAAERRRLDERLAELDGRAPRVPELPDGVDARRLRADLARLRRHLRDVLGVLADLDDIVEPGAVRRRSLLPPGIVAETPEAAEALVRVPGVIVLVDGYNVTRRVWEDRPLGEQRAELHRRLATLAARTGARFEIVWDGVEAAGVADTGDGVREIFTAADVEADDEILRRAAVRLGDALVVASNDRRVRDGARAVGVDVIASDDLLGLIGVTPPS
ncbi:MAG: hypothetical protein D6683_07460, partial [Actinomyces sp.]